MNILHISARYKDLIGGDAIYLNSLVENQEKLNNKVYIFTAGNEKFELISNKKVLRELSQIKKNFWNLNFYNRKVAKDLDKCIAEIKPDVIHIHGIHQYFTLSTIKILKKYNHIKTIFTVHDYKILCGNAGFMNCNCFEKIHSNSFMRWCYHTSNFKSIAINLQMSLWYRSDFFSLIDIFHCGSQFVKDLIQKNPLIGAKATKVRFPYLQSISTSDNEISSKKEVFFIGRLVEHKGIEIFLSSLCEEKNINIKIFGDGPLMPRLKKQYSSFKNIHFEGWKKAKEINAECSAGSIVVAPFLAPETFCYSVLESLMRGNVVIAFKSGAIPELINNNNGILVNHNEIRVAVIDIINNFNRRKEISKNALKIAHDVKSPYDHSIEIGEMYRC